MKSVFLLSIILLFSLNAEEFYKVEEIKHPDSKVALEIGGMCLDSEGGLMMTTRRGEVWQRKADGSWKLFAYGLQEPLGIRPGAWPGEYYVLQRPELTRLLDEDKDGVADLYDSFAKGWGFTGNYHSYAMAFSQDKEGNFYGGLGLPFSVEKNNPFKGKWLGTLKVHDRGMFFKIDPAGNYSQYASGVREPVGSAFNESGDLFITDTQGSFICTNWVMHVEKGDFLGHPDSLFWDKSRPGLADKLIKMPLKERNEELNKLRKRPVLYMPYRKFGASVGGLTFDTTGGKFGPFSGQMIIAEVIDSLLMRANIEKVDGVYQGAVFRLSTKVGRGGMRPVFAKDGSLYLGKTARGWGSGSGLAKINWSGEVPFDIKEIKILKNGFKINFTKKVSELQDSDIKFESFVYEYTNGYTARMENKKPLKVSAVKLDADGMGAELSVEGLAEDTVINVNYGKIKDSEGKHPVFQDAWYTLNKLPK